MELKTYIDNVKSFNYLIVAYDVAKYKHNFHTSFEDGKHFFKAEGVIKSTTSKLIEHFNEVKVLAKQHGFHGVRIVCEPTGGYEKNLLRQARTMGFLTEYVNGEATSKSKVIETNDSGKNDIKDARIIFSLASQNKTLTCQEHDGVYGHLKLLSGKYEDVCLDLSRLKNCFSSAVDHFFPDLSLTGSQLHSKICRAVIDKISLNPYKIAMLSYDKFKKKIEAGCSRKVSGSVNDLLMKIWNAAQTNALAQVPQWEVDEYEDIINDYYKRIVETEKRKLNYRVKMEKLFTQTKEYQKLLNVPANNFMLARIIAETGPFDNFSVLEKLVKYAGLNLKEHASGTYSGQVRLSKKGNSLLRKVLGQIAFTFFTKRDSIYGDYFQKKKEKMGGIYGLTCVMRKVLKMLYGTYKSAESFKVERVRNQKVETVGSAA